MQAFRVLAPYRGRRRIFTRFGYLHLPSGEIVAHRATQSPFSRTPQRAGHRPQKSPTGAGAPAVPTAASTGAATPVLASTGAVSARWRRVGAGVTPAQGRRDRAAARQLAPGARTPAASGPATVATVTSGARPEIPPTPYPVSTPGHPLPVRGDPETGPTARFAPVERNRPPGLHTRRGRRNSGAGAYPRARARTRGRACERGGARQVIHARSKLATCAPSSRRKRARK